MECCVLMGDGDEEVYAAWECDVGDGNLVLTQAIGKFYSLVVEDVALGGYDEGGG